MEPKYKIGDKVKIKSRYDDGCDENSYKFTFTTSMLADFGGRVVTINYIDAKFNSRLVDCPVPDDGYLYRFDDGWQFYWASSMFEEEF